MLKINQLYKISSFGPLFWYSTTPIPPNHSYIYDRKIKSEFPFVLLSLENECPVTKSQIIKILTKDGIGYLRLSETTKIEEVV